MPKLALVGAAASLAATASRPAPSSPLPSAPAGATGLAGSNSSPVGPAGSAFGKVLQGAPPAPAGAPPTPAAVTGSLPPPPATAPPGLLDLLRRGAGAVARADGKLEKALARVQGGGGVGPRELIKLQVEVYEASMSIQLAGKLMERATSGLKQVLQTQV